MSEYPSAGALHALALVATVRTALAATLGIAERRAGRDPAAQEPPWTAGTDLALGVGRVAGLALHLRLRAAAPPVGRAEATRLAQAFEDQLALAELARELHRAHQKLLSLYPDVPEALVEQTRRLHGRAEALGHHAAPETGFAAFAEALVGWTARVGAALQELGEDDF
ncbi:MAG: hypothetical protein ACK41D_06940 [Rubricoccaceae bacterium]